MEQYDNNELALQKEKILNENVSIMDAKIYEIPEENELSELLAVVQKIKNNNEEYTYKTDILLAIKMYDIPFFSNMSKEEANKENLWATINIEYMSEYTLRRWNIDNQKKENKEIRIFKKGKLLYNRNSLARLWWITKLTVDESLDDKFMYTKLILSRSQFEQSIMESSLSKNNKILKNLLCAIMEIENECQYKISSDEIIKIISSLNRIGGTYVLDIMDYKYFRDHITDVLELDY